MYSFRSAFALQILQRGLLYSGIIEDLVSQLADSLNADRFPMLLMAIDSEQEIGDQAGKHLDHKAMAAS